MSMFDDISCGTKDNEKECVANAKVVSLYAKKFGIGQLSFIGPGSEKKWYSMEENSPQGIWDHIAEKMLLEFAESGCPIFRATSPLSRGQLKSKGHGKLSIHFAATQATIETVSRIIVAANQLSLYGAVANMCEEYESRHDRTGRPDKVMGQSIVLSEIKTEVPLENDDPEYRNFPLQRYEERIERLSQQDKVSEICMDARFLRVVEIGQYFMTKDTGASRKEAMLYICEDNEAVIKMIIKGRSPTMRHVSRTHRVALGWLFDRINLDTKIQIKYIDTKNQLADILTKENFTRCEWNHLLCVCVQYLPFQLHQQRQRDVEKNTRRCR